MSLSWVEATRLASKGGPADRLRRWLIAGCAALGTLLTSAIVSIPSFWSSNDSVSVESMLGFVVGDRDIGIGAMVGLSLLVVIVIHLTATAAAFGAPARDRRLAAMRAAGATGDDVSAVQRVEAHMWSLPGVLVGLGLFYLLMSVVVPRFTVAFVQGYDDEARVEQLPVLIMKDWPHPLAVVGAALLVPILLAWIVPMVGRTPGTGSAIRREGRAHRSPWVAITLVGTYIAAIVIVVGLLVLVRLQESAMAQAAMAGVLMVTPLVLVLNVVATLAWSAEGLTSWMGRLLCGRSSATSVLAGRMMQARPSLATRTAVSLVLVALVGGLAVSLRSSAGSVTVHNAEVNGYSADEFGGVLPFDVVYFTASVDAVQVLTVVAGCLGAVGFLVAVADQVSRRGSGLARQVALGVPRGVLRRSLVIEVVAPVSVMVSIAMAVGVAAPMGLAMSASDAVIVDAMHWGRLAGLWVLLVGGATLAAWVGGFALPRTSDPQRIRDRE
ncbi:FtsX-like permease family protein [Janibacter limosus]|uniref:ABC3 transporter permease C-terminal domain-containing protein n=1 Tax=Janibacter limosus TaxID=53458 RepID=A0A4P6MUN4_9MICO|nr:FtsX-like permease family protein [Janibacter limosus]QBF45220.1 hypothetical protein EXU32_02410 [Janibacter limosus]